VTLGLAHGEFLPPPYSVCTSAASPGSESTQWQDSYGLVSHLFLFEVNYFFIKEHLCFYERLAVVKFSH